MPLNGNELPLYFRLKNRRSDAQTKTIRGLSMASCGFSEQVLPGGISQSAMVLGRLSQDAFIVGGNREYGRPSSRDYNSKPSSQGKSIGKSISLMAALEHQHAAGAIRGELDPNSELSAIEQVHYSGSFRMVKRRFQYQNSPAHSMAMDYR